MLSPDAVASEARLPITESQKGLLVVQGRVSSRDVYNQLVRFDLDPAISADAVEQALVGLVAIQPAMRQVFGRWPELHARLTPPLDVSELPLERVTVPAGEFEDAVASMARRIGPPEFDLASGPAYRFATVRAADHSASTVLLCDHHVILDGLSMGPLVRDLEDLLAGTLSEATPAEKRSAREAAFARELDAQSRSARSAEVSARSQAWAARLRDVPPLVLAPRPGRPTQTSFSGARVSWTMSDRETVAFGATCRRLDITPFVAFTAIYGAVLARHGSTSQVLIGSPFMARRTIGAFDLGGFFVNTLPVTVDVDWDASVDEHLGQTVRRAVDFCRANVDVTFSRLVADVAPDRSSDRNPLFSAMLAMQDTFSPESAVAVLRLSELGNETAKFDVWLGVTPVDGRWMLELEYDRELISPPVADDLLASLRTAVRLAITDGSWRVADLFVDASPTTSVRSDGWAAPLSGLNPVGWVEASAQRTPEAPAVEEPARRMTYAELVAASERVAAGLAARGVDPGDVVGLVADDLCDAVTAILGILRRGAAYLPLDPGFPQERLAYMVHKAGCALAVGRLALPGLRAVSIDELAAARPPHRPMDCHRDPDAPVYVMFTSGSTGEPKGVQMGQRPLANLTAWQIAALGMDSETRFMQYAPLGFDVSFQEILPTLASGGTVVSRQPADRRFLPAVLGRIAQAGVTHAYLPVAALQPLVQLAMARDVRLPSLRYVCVSGEQLLVDELMRDFFAVHPHCTLVNLYGPTETHAVTSYRLSGRDPRWPTHVPIGIPYPNVAAYVVDATGHLAPAGVAGELYFGGACQADGYVNDPQRTAERFVPDRFAVAAGGTMYRTGDLVIRDENGQLVFLGRADTQVKIRGYRIELGELEAVANQLGEVRQSVAVARGDGGDREIVLFVRGEPEAPVDLHRVSARLGAALPPYMQPARIFEAERIPTTATGKTDRDALVALADELVLAERQADAAVTAIDYADDLERDLAAIWSGVLGVDGIPRQRPVFEFGAHSLNIFTALAEVEERYGVSVPVVDFFGSPTIATLAELVRAERPAHAVAS